MTHLRRVAVIDLIIAVLDVLVAVAALVGGVALALWAHQQGDDNTAAFWLAAGLFTALMAMLGAVLLAVLARLVSQGRGRIGQTVAGVLCLMSWPPLGLLIGGYMLWVCWQEPGAVATFEGSGSAGAALEGPG